MGSGALLGGGAIGCRFDTSSELSDGRPNIVVYLADTMRADHLSVYGYEWDTSPWLREFGGEGAVFEQTYSHAPWTKPSIGSLFTGVRPLVHQASISSWNFEHLMEQQVQMLRPQFQTLAEIMKSRGYATGYFLTNPHSQKEFGFAQGFDQYLYKGSETPTGLVDEVEEWITGEAKAPYFVFVHEINPHGPYTPSATSYMDLHGVSADTRLKSLPRADAELMDALRLHYAQEGERPVLARFSEEGSRYLQALYDAEIRGVDDEFRRLCEFMMKRGDWENSVVAFTSDHGEGFGEHGNYYHGNSLFDELIHVPLIIGGGGIERGRVSHSVNHFDLFPTLVDLAGGEVPDYVQGSALLDGNGRVLVDSDRAVFSDHDAYSPEVDSWASSMVLGRHKVYRHLSRIGSKLNVFDREADPGETVDLLETVGENDPVVAELLAKYRSGQEASAALASGFGVPQWRNDDAATVEELKALGYLE